MEHTYLVIRIQHLDGLVDCETIFGKASSLAIAESMIHKNVNETIEDNNLWNWDTTTFGKLIKNKKITTRGGEDKNLIYGDDIKECVYDIGETNEERTWYKVVHIWLDLQGDEL